MEPMPIDYTSHLRSDGELFAQAAMRDLEAHVPTCPDWNVTQLMTHLGRHHRWVANAVRGGGAAPDETSDPDLSDDDLVAWSRQGWQELADLLDGMDDETPAWSWSGDNRVGFWRRRTALETLVHRWDAEFATGRPTSLDPTLSSDGVDEMMFVMITDEPEIYHGPSGRIGLSTTDVPGAWTLHLPDGDAPVPSLTVEGDEDPSTTVSAPAEELLLFLWGRRGPDAVKVSGSNNLFEGLLAYME